jgi:pimeloyl-ACP methyl ester carboxylesterase
MPRGIFIFLASVVLLALAAAFCAWRYDEALAIDSPRGVDQSGYVRIGGIDQWVQIRGDDNANPVLLWLNGGPGYSTIPQTLFYRDWQKYFTLVMWNQRGEGKSLERSGSAIAPTMTIPQMAEDGIAVTEYLRKHLGKNRVILLGHSWGSILGTEIVRRRPDLFYAYVGTGQVERMDGNLQATYPRLVEQARIRNNRNALAELQAAGAPPYANPEKYFVILKWANAFDPPSRRAFSAASLWATGKAILQGAPGAMFSQRLLLPAMLKDDQTTAKLKIPIVIIEGDKGLVTPRSKNFFDAIATPRKSYVILPGDGHLAIFADPSRFLKVLVAQVRPSAN